MHGIQNISVQLLGYCSKFKSFEKEDSWGKLSSQCANAIFSIESPSTLVSVKERFEALRSHVDTFKEAVMNICISLLTRKVETFDSDLFQHIRSGVAWRI